MQYLNNIVEQDHRNVKRRTWLAKGYDSLLTACRTLRGIETMDMLRKGRATWWAKQSSSAACSASPLNPPHQAILSSA
jgi:transposase-like protein